MKYFTILFLALTISIFAKNNNSSLKKQNDIKSVGYTHFNINNISTLIFNDGTSDSWSGSAPGFVFPKGSGKTAVFESGLVWGAMIQGDSDPRVGGSTYSSGLQPGKILSSGTAEDPNLPKNRIYRVRKDVYPGSVNPDLFSEINDGEGDYNSIKRQYETDWNEWPAADGAPFVDINSNGIYDPNIDIPGVEGADQTIWYVANDLDQNKTQSFYGALPLGVEMQVTVWGYKNPLYANVLFRKYKIINKSNDVFNNMYISMWSDQDVGDNTDDYAGCDSVLNLGFTYNSKDYDKIYGNQPPAVGLEFLNLPMKSFYYLTVNDPLYSYPFPGGNTGEGNRFYNFMQGKIGNTGQYFYNPVTKQNTTFTFSGDPLTGNGWNDGQYNEAGDRMIGISSGPFQLAPGDTKEIVIAEAAEMGTDRLNSVKLLKDKSAEIQNLYNNSFNNSLLPPYPSTIELQTKYDDNIELQWDNNSENFSENGYQFQGYNIYQLNDKFSLKKDGKKIATFDEIDGIKTIISGSDTLQNGTDSGIKNSFTVTKDELENYDLVKGKTYYFAVTAYTYNPNASSMPSTESLLNTVSITFEDSLPGPSFGNGFLATHVAGMADANVNPIIYDPAKLTGDDYEVYFSQRQEIRDANGDWISANSISKKLGTDTLSGTSIGIAAVYGAQAGTIELKFSLSLVSNDLDFADGISLKFPSGVTILDVKNSKVIPQINGHVINMGNVSHEYTKNGPFTGGEEWSVIIKGSVPISVDWVVYDDGYSGGPVDASGTTEVNSIGNESRLAKYWNLKDATTDIVKLENQGIWGDKYIFPLRDDISNNQMISNPKVDGFQLSVNGTYAAPTVPSSYSIQTSSGSIIGTGNSPSDTRTIFANYMLYGLPTSWAIDGFGFGTSDANKLQQDYEIRYTGIIRDTIINGRNVKYVASGGQMATIFSTVVGEAGLADHPMNPNPGAVDPFLIRIPFEVWNKDTYKQVNVMFRDRAQDLYSDPFYAWNPNDRNYIVIVNDDYNPTHVFSTTDPAAESDATWIVIIYSTHLALGDIVTITYPNPIQFGVDKYTFSTAGPFVSVNDKQKISSYQLFQNYPNPFNPITIIKYSIPQTQNVTIKVFGILGNEITTLVNKEMPAGNYEIKFDGKKFASGIYFYRLQAGDFIQTRKMILLK